MDKSHRKHTYGYNLISTVLGWVGILASPVGISNLTLPQESPNQVLVHLKTLKLTDIKNISKIAFPDIEKRIQNYFLGEKVVFKDVLDLSGTCFQKKAWEMVRMIPRGETRSYGWIARLIGKPGAARAVGQAMRSNPVPIIVPCHRVIGGDGKIGGYGGPNGTDLKNKLLNMESGKATYNQYTTARNAWAKYCLFVDNRS